jgi:FKBP-type peptidyl-prolyl cis-trans isomerase SlpA
MHCSLSLPDGTEALSTYGESPMEFTLGDGTMEPLLEYALLGLRTGDEQTWQVLGNEIFGPPDENNLHWLKTSEFPSDMMLAEAQIIRFTNDQGIEVPGTVKQIDGDQVLIDFNHPLSGKTIHYTVTILGVEQPG